VSPFQGLPILVAGSNTHVAWGFTNTHGDWTDVIAVNVDPEDATRYLTAQGPKSFEKDDEIIRVRGQDEETLTITRTQWVPVVAMDATGRPLVLAWTASGWLVTGCREPRKLLATVPVRPFHKSCSSNSPPSRGP
jgi:acyl-homoserine lactone acylase PvdQ